MYRTVTTEEITRWLNDGIVELDQDLRSGYISARWTRTGRSVVFHVA